MCASIAGCTALRRDVNPHRRTNTNVVLCIDSISRGIKTTPGVCANRAVYIIAGGPCSPRKMLPLIFRRHRFVRSKILFYLRFAENKYLVFGIIASCCSRFGIWQGRVIHFEYSRLLFVGKRGIEKICVSPSAERACFPRGFNRLV